MNESAGKTDYLIPDELVKLMSRLDSRGFALLEAGNYSRAELVFRDQLSALMKAQKEKGRRIHKGAPLHNIGLCLLMSKKGESIRFISAAFLEDVLSHGPDESLSYPASRLLLALGAEREGLSKIAGEIARKLEPPSEILDPLELAKIRDGEMNVLGLVLMIIPAELELPPQETVDSARSPPVSVMDKVDRNIAALGGPSSLKVFIGGSYRNIALLRYISSVVEDHGIVPVLVCDLPVPFSRKESHDGSMEMLQHCHYAIFEVSFPNGYMMEIERCHEIKKRRNLDVLMSWQRQKWSGDLESSIPSKMLILKGFGTCRYTKLRGLSNRIASIIG